MALKSATSLIVYFVFLLAFAPTSANNHLRTANTIRKNVLRASSPHLKRASQRALSAWQTLTSEEKEETVSLSDNEYSDIQQFSEVCAETTPAPPNNRLLELDCRINGGNVRAYVDTGAEITVVSKSCAHRLGLDRLIKKHPHPSRCVGLGSSHLVGTIPSIPLSLGSSPYTTHPTTLHVLSSDLGTHDDPTDVLIGLDFLEKVGARICVKGGTMEVDGIGGVDGSRERITFLGGKTRSTDDNTIKTIHMETDPSVVKTEGQKLRKVKRGGSMSTISGSPFRQREKSDDSLSNENDSNYRSNYGNKFNSNNYVSNKNHCCQTSFGVSSRRSRRRVSPPKPTIDLPPVNPGVEDDLDILDNEDVEGLFSDEETVEGIIEDVDVEDDDEDDDNDDDDGFVGVLENGDGEEFDLSGV